MTPILYRIPLLKSMVKVSQFVSRNIMTRDKMSQPLVAWCLGLVACSFFYFFPDPCSSHRAYLEFTGTNNKDQGSVKAAHPHAYKYAITHGAHWSQVPWVLASSNDRFRISYATRSRDQGSVGLSGIRSPSYWSQIRCSRLLQSSTSDQGSGAFYGAHQRRSTLSKETS